MAISAITNLVSSYVQQVTGSTPTTSSNPNNPAIANKEANEPLPLLTKQAKHGDQVAKLILKKIQKRDAAKAQQAEPARSPAEPGKGEQVDQHA